MKERSLISMPSYSRTWTAMPGELIARIGLRLEYRLCHGPRTFVSMDRREPAFGDLPDIEMKVEYLADHPSHLPTVAAWQHAQFGYLTPNVMLKDRTER